LEIKINNNINNKTLLLLYLFYSHYFPFNKEA